MEEVWKPVVGCEGYYEVSDRGRIRSVDRVVYTNRYKNGRYRAGQIKKSFVEKRGYAQITLHKNGVRIYSHVHRIVANAFIPNPEDKPQVNHKDGNRVNNCVENLEWVTALENQIHSYKVLGRTASEETRKKMSIAHTNPPEKTRKKMSEAQKRRNLSLSNNPMAKTVIRLDDKKIYGSIKEAAMDVGITKQCISLACNHHQKTAGGYRWAFYEEGET